MTVCSPGVLELSAEKALMVDSEDSLLGKLDEVLYGAMHVETDVPSYGKLAWEEVPETTRVMHRKMYYKWATLPVLRPCWRKLWHKRWRRR